MWKGLTFLPVLVLDLTHCLCQQQLVVATVKREKKQLCLFFRHIILIPINERKFKVRFVYRIEICCTDKTSFIIIFIMFVLCPNSPPLVQRWDIPTLECFTNIPTLYHNVTTDLMDNALHTFVCTYVGGKRIKCWFLCFTVKFWFLMLPFYFILHGIC